MDNDCTASETQGAIASEIAKQFGSPIFDLRTALDTLACHDPSPELAQLLRNRNGGPCTFNWGDLRSRTRRQLILERFKFISPRARGLFEKADSASKLPDLPPKHPDRLICDHVVPIADFRTKLEALKEMDQLSGIDVVRLFFQLYRRCIIAGDEDAKLSTYTMPPNWQIGDRVFARYDRAGFDWAKDWN